MKYYVAACIIVHTRVRDGVTTVKTPVERTEITQQEAQ